MQRLRQNLFIAFGLALIIITSSAKSKPLDSTTTPESQPTPALEQQAAIQNPRTTTCLELISGCGSIRIGDQSILLQPSQSTRELDGSTTISGTAHWINRSEVSESSAPFAITLPKPLSALSNLPSLEPQRIRTESPSSIGAALECANTIAEPKLQDRVLAQVAEVMMGQEAISRRAALFAATCMD